MSSLIDPFSFFVGFIAASIFWWLVAKARPMWDELTKTLKEQREEAKAQKTSAVEENHRRVTLRRAQGMHAAAALFALDEILQTPRLMIPPPPMDPAAPQRMEDVVSQTLPYLPAWPELGAAYRAPSFTLPEALSGSANLVIVGQPGMGKTVALAHLASLCANRAEELGDLKNFAPILVHVADLNLPADAKDVLKPLIDALLEYAPLLDLARLPGFVEASFKNGKALLLLDGYDELAPAEQQVAAEYLKSVIQKYPKTRIVTTGAPEYLDGLISMGFVPLALMAWSQRENEAFIEHWGKLWSETVGMEAWAQNAEIEPIDPLLLNTWLKTGNVYLSPLELTLKVWGAYAGDLLGAGALEALVTHIRRLTPAETPLEALETLAMQVMLSAQPVFDPRKAREWVKAFETVEQKPEGESADAPAEEDADAEKEDKKKKKGKKGEKGVPAASTGLLGKLAESGLLATYPNNRMRFVHPTFAAYLAGRALAGYDADNALINQPEWSGKYLTVRYLSVYSEVSAIVKATLGRSRMPTHRPLFAAARWLRDAPKNAAWRGELFGALAAILKTENIPLSLRGEAMAALVFSGDPSARILFRQFATGLSFELAQLAILGAGAARDAKAVEVLLRVMDAPNMAVRRAACMALVAIGTEQALEAVAHTLLSGDEEIRRAAAEALATDPKEGYAMLKEAMGMSDILLRRSAVYGLARVSEDWATEMLQKVQVEDDQWVVRNAAAEVLEAKVHPGALAPRKLKAPSEAPWLVEFAAKQGVGIVPGSPATDVLLQAIKSEDETLRLAALPYLKFTPADHVLAEIYNAMYSDHMELREAAFRLIWELDAAGLQLPNPAQYGYN